VPCAREASGQRRKERSDVGNYLNSDCYDEGAGRLTLWLVEEHDGPDILDTVGIYGDPD
jgi:hypothetical protein